MSCSLLLNYDWISPEVLFSPSNCKFSAPEKPLPIPKLAITTSVQTSRNLLVKIPLFEASGNYKKLISTIILSSLEEGGSELDATSCTASLAEAQHSTIRSLEYDSTS